MDQPDSLTNWIHSLGLSDSTCINVRNRLEALGFNTLKALLQDGQKSDLELSGIPSSTLIAAWDSLIKLRSSGEGLNLEMTLELHGKSIKFIVPFQHMIYALKQATNSDDDNWVDIQVAPNQYITSPNQKARVNFTCVGQNKKVDTNPLDTYQNSMLHRWSLCSSLSDEEWQEATNGGKPLSEWSVSDVVHWVLSFEPLKKYADKFDILKVDGNHIISLIFNHNGEEDSSERIETLAESVGMVMRAHRRLFSNELTLLVRSCHMLELNEEVSAIQPREEYGHNLNNQLTNNDTPANPINHQTHAIDTTIQENLPSRPLSASPQSSGGSGQDRSGNRNSKRKPNRKINMITSPRSKSRSPCSPANAYEMTKAASGGNTIKGVLKKSPAPFSGELSPSSARHPFSQWESMSDGATDDNTNFDMGCALKLDEAVFRRRDGNEAAPAHDGMMSPGRLNNHSNRYGMMSPAGRLDNNSRRYSEQMIDQMIEMRSPTAEVLKRNTMKNAQSKFQRGSSAPVTHDTGGMMSPNARKTNHKKPILPSPLLTSPVPAEYTASQKKKIMAQQVPFNQKAKSLPSLMLDPLSDDELNETMGGRRSHKSLPGVGLNLDLVNAEFDEANEMSYELTEAGTLITSGFRIDTHGISAAPVPQSARSRVSSRNHSRGPSRQASEKFSTPPDSPTSDIGEGEMNMPSHSMLFPATDVKRGVSQADTRMKWGSTKDGLVILEELGRGAAGCVRKALYVPELLLVAVKDVPVHDDNRRRQLLRELTMLNDVGNALLPNDCMHQQAPSKSHKGFNMMSPSTRPPGLQTSPKAHRWYPHENDHHGTDRHPHSDRVIEMIESIDMSDDPLNSSYSKMPNNDPCPYIVSCLDAYTDLENGSICLVLEFMNAGSLDGFIKAKAEDPENVIIPESLIAMVAESVLGGLAVIHSRKQLHRDIKPSNILLDCSNNVKISDFGVGKELNSMSLANSFTGTFAYMSPERISGNEYSYSSDVWSVGLSLLTLAQGKFPLPTNKGYWALVRAVQDEPSPVLEPPPAGHPPWSNELKSFLELCLIKDPEERPLPWQLLKHPFLVHHRARADQIPGSPPVKPTPGLISKLKDIVKAAAQFHAKKIVPDFDIESIVLVVKEEDKNPLAGKLGMRKNQWLPEIDMDKLSSLALQLNMAIDVVSDVFRSVWADVNEAIDHHFAT